MRWKGWTGWTGIIYRSQTTTQNQTKNMYSMLNAEANTWSVTSLLISSYQAVPVRSHPRCQRLSPHRYIAVKRRARGMETAPPQLHYRPCSSLCAIRASSTLLGNCIKAANVLLMRINNIIMTVVKRWQPVNTASGNRALVNTARVDG